MNYVRAELAFIGWRIQLDGGTTAAKQSEPECHHLWPAYDSLERIRKSFSLRNIGLAESTSTRL